MPVFAIIVLAPCAARRYALDGIWLMTIHDCLVPYPENIEMVKRGMEEAFGTVGVRPTIKVTVFN